MTLPAGTRTRPPEIEAFLNSLTPEQKTLWETARTARKTARTARRAEMRGPWGDILKEILPLIRTGLGQMKPGGDPFDAIPFFDSFYAKVPAQYQQQVRDAVGDLPTRINDLIGKIPSGGATIQPINPPATPPAEGFGGFGDLGDILRAYMSQMGNKTPGAPRPGMNDPWSRPPRQPMA